MKKQLHLLPQALAKGQRPGDGLRGPPSSRGLKPRSETQMNMEKGSSLNDPPVPEGLAGSDRDFSPDRSGGGAPAPARIAGRPWVHGSAKHRWSEGSGYAAARYGEWFESLASWQWFVTRTYDPSKLGSGYTQAGVRTMRRCLRDLLARTEARNVVCVFERQSRGDYHLHALLGGCRALDGAAEQERDRRVWGIARWKMFNGTGAGSYLAKYVAKDMSSELYIGLEGPYVLRTQAALIPLRV